MGQLFTRVFAIFALIGMISASFATSSIASDSRTHHITMSGYASVGAAPDRVEINLGVMSKAKTARDALTLNNANMNNIIKTLEESGVEKKYIQTSNFSISPNYQHFKNGQPAKVRGYTVNNAVRIHLIDIKKLGILLDKVVTSGSNRINGIRFFVSKQDELKDEARKLAVKVALRKASLYATAAGVELGDVMTITESSNSGRVPVMMARSMAANSPAVPIAGGEQQLGVSVIITWEIK